MKKIFLFFQFLLISSILLITQVFAIEVKVTEVVPGANCSGSSGDVTCQIPSGFSAVTNIFGEMIKYFTFIAVLGAVLFIVINGILYSMSGINDSLKSTAKDRIIKTLLGLILLVLSGFILNTLAPWVYK